MTGTNDKTNPDHDRGPIQLEPDAKPEPTAGPKPTNHSPLHKTAPPSPNCPDCGASLAGIVGARCPNCGADAGMASVAKHRWDRANAEQRAEYWKWVRIALIGLAVMAAALAFRGWIDGEMDKVPMQIVVALLKYAALVPLGYLAYMLLALIWLGSDDPAGITILRLAAVYALADAATAILTILFILFLTQALIFAAYVGLLMKFLELDPVEAMMLALLTAAIKFIALVWLLSLAGIV